MTSLSADAPEGQLALYELLRLLPDLRALVPMRQALLAASSADEAKRWERGPYATLDARLLSAERIEQVARAVARDEAKAVEHLLRDVGRALQARAEGRPEEAAAVFIETAVDLIERNRFYEAAALLEVCHRDVAHGGNVRLEAQVARWLAKASWRVGRLPRAAELYRRAHELFSQLGDRPMAIVTLQGLANVCGAAGRWRESVTHNQAALALTGDGEDLLRGQIANNLSQVTRRLGDLEAAERWQARAEAVWAGVDSVFDRVVSLNNRGLLHLEAGALLEARDALQRGLAIADGDLQRAVLLTNLAIVANRAGRLTEAEHLAREAEEFAILAGAADILVEAYTALACACRDQDDARCVVFFEKAIELARESEFPLSEARARIEYGRYRRTNGDADEAEAHFRRAVDLCPTEDSLERMEALAELA